MHYYVWMTWNLLFCRSVGGMHSPLPTSFKRTRVRQNLLGVTNLGRQDKFHLVMMKFKQHHERGKIIKDGAM